MTRIPDLVLMNGVRIPQLGFGTYRLTENVVDVVQSAINLGYRHLDTAQMYHNEAQVGEAWQTSGVSRSSFFLTTKLDNPNHRPAVARRTFERSLEDLRTDYVDLFLIHWPLPMYYEGEIEKTWRVLEQLYEEGLARAIGVSNFLPHHIDRIRDHCSLRPMVNQIESHPYYPNSAVHRFDRDNGILTEAWAPLARGRVASDSVLKQIGEPYGKNASQVAIRWGLQRGDILFPKASTVERQKQNLNVFDFSLDESDMLKIGALAENESARTGMDPDRMERLKKLEIVEE